MKIDVELRLHRPGGTGRGVNIGANCCIANARIAAGAVIHPYTHIDGEKPAPPWARAP